MNDKLEHRWYVLRAVSGQERKVKGYLDTEIERQGIQDLVRQILIPIEKVVVLKDGKVQKDKNGATKVKEKIFYPGYIMMEAIIIPETINRVMHLVTSIPGIIGFLGNEPGMRAKDPVPLTDGEVKRLLGRTDELDAAEAVMEVPFLKNESVKVIDGPFNGFMGTVEDIFDDRKKLNVVVKIFGRNTPVELSYAQVERTV